MTSRPARPKTLLDFINRPILKGVAPAGNLKRVFTGKSGQNRKKTFGRVMYASETIQNCKNPTGHRHFKCFVKKSRQGFYVHTQIELSARACVNVYFRLLRDNRIATRQVRMCLY